MEKKYTISDAVNEAISSASSKKRNFTESFEIIVNLDLGEKDEVLRGGLELPNKMTKEKKVAVFAENGSEKFKAAQEAGADFVGMDDLISDITAKKIPYDVYLASAALMPKLKKIASKLGPRNKMPNNKLGTLLDNPEMAVAKMKNQTVFFKTIKGCAQTMFGDLAMSSEALIENASFVIKNLIEQFKNAHPTKEALKSIYVKTTMGKIFEIDPKTCA